jgi:hypothetical protein
MIVNPVLITLASITSLFVVMLIIKRITGWKICAICASISLTWIVLLVLYWTGRFPYPVLVGILMGQSVVGIYYLLEKKVNEDLLIFRLPFLLSATVLVFLLLGFVDELLGAVVFLVAVWLTFGITYLYRNNPKMRAIVKKLIECCKNW